MPCYPVKEMLSKHVSHSACKFRNRYLIVSGGSNTNLTEIYDAEKDTAWRGLGGLVKQRGQHASISTVDKTYVFCGFNTSDVRALSSIEEKDMSGDNPANWESRPWREITITEGILKPRYNLGVSMLSDGSILIIGGESI